MDRLLLEGRTGEDVRAAQALLNYHLRLPEYKPLNCDGIFGPKTAARTIRFQTLNHLHADGVIGPKTRAKLLDNRDVCSIIFLQPCGQGHSPFDLLRRLFGALASRLSDAVRALLLPFLTAPPPSPPPAPQPQPTPQPAPQPAPSVGNVQVFWGQAANIHPYFLSPAVLILQGNYLFLNNHAQLSGGGQLFYNQLNSPNGRWTGQAFLQIGTNELLKHGNFDPFNPYVGLAYSWNDKALNNAPQVSIGFQSMWKIGSLLGGDVSLFLNGQAASNVVPDDQTKKLGFASPTGQLTTGLSWTAISF
jgi:hypothetical protein